MKRTGRRSAGRACAARPSTGASHSVGYGKPPRQHQFQRGRCGNPKGRPKGLKNTDTLLREILNRQVEMRTGGLVRKISVREAMLTRLTESALKGDIKAGLSARHTLDGAIHFVCMDWRHAPELFAAGAAVYDELKNICVWVKNNAGQGTFYRSQHELVFVFKHGRVLHLNTFELGQHGRMRSNVWHYAGVNSFRAGRMDDLSIHPTVKPVALVADAMRDCSRRGSIILDAFAGSGTTIVAAEQIGRRAFCLELDPAYVDVAIRRWQRLTSCDAVLEVTGETFDELAAGRSYKVLRAKRHAKAHEAARR